MPGLSYDSGRLTVLGTISANQSWSINIGYEAAALPSSSDLATWLASLATPLTTWWNTTNGPKTINSSDTLVTGMRTEYYLAGNTIPSSSAIYSLASALAGTGTSYGPTQTSMVHSLLTGSPSKHNRGRLYVPTTAPGVGSNHQHVSTIVDAMCNAMSTFLHAINISSIAGSAPTVIVRGQGAFSGLPVTQVRVDSEPDVQRRRADKLVAAYTKTATV